MQEKHRIAYAVDKIKNLSNTTSGLAHKEEHNLRTDMPENADPTKQNKTIVALKYKSFVDAYNEKVNNALNNGDMKYVRSDAVKAVEVVATFTNPVYTQEDLDKWTKETTEFTAKNFGGMDNIISAELHMDELSPHIHYVIIPMKDNRLNCKGYIDGPTSLSNLQDKYAEEVGQKYGLQRGKRYKTYRKAANKYTTISNFKAATIGKAVIDAEEITEPKKDELRDNGDIIPELYIPRIKNEIEQSNFAHLKEKNAISNEVNEQESDLISYYMQLQDELRRQYEQKEKEAKDEQEKAKNKRLEYIKKIEQLEEFLLITKGSIENGDMSLSDIKKSLNTQKYLSIGLAQHPDKKKVEKAKEQLNEIIEYGHKVYHEEKDDDIKKVNKLIR